MKRAAAVVALFVFAPVISAETERYVVALEPRVGVTAGPKLLRDIDGASPSRDRGVALFRTLDAFAADLTGNEVAALRRSPGVRYVERVIERHILGSTTFAAAEVFRNLNGQTVPVGIDIVRGRDIWAITRGETVNVAVLDTGVDYHHPDLAHAWAGGYNAIDQTNDPMDDNDHGTHVAGTIAAADNDLGVVGVAPRVHLWGVKVLDAAGDGTSDNIMAGIDWVIGQKRTLGGNWIINMSFGSTKDNVAEREAVARAIAEGILVVAASGNQSRAAPKPVLFPAAYPGVVAVGAVDAQLQHAPFSNQGTELAAVAPGVDILSSVRVGTVTLSAVQTEMSSYAAAPLVGSAHGTVTGNFVFCGIGREEEFPPAVNGRIAVIQRGEITFALKAKRAQAAGATAVVIVNHDTTPLRFTLINPDDPSSTSYNWPLTLAISKEDGERLLANPASMITIAHEVDEYGAATGTSMAAPHVTGVAALLWSIARPATAFEIRSALLTKATDLGARGFDTLHGHGLVNAVESAKLLTPAGIQPSGRRVLRRGR